MHPYLILCAIHQFSLHPFGAIARYLAILLDLEKAQVRGVVFTVRGGAGSQIGKNGTDAVRPCRSAIATVPLDNIRATMSASVDTLSIEYERRRKGA